MTFLEEMAWRGQIHQATDVEALARHLAAGSRRTYVGFDPTADSLTIGNLVGIMALARWQRAGHSPVAVMGGGTGLIGDPSGKSAERALNSREVVEANVRSIQTIFDRVLDFSPSSPARATIVNNLDWLGKLGLLEALRDIGKHLSVNMMIQKDSVRERLHNREQGISYAEFSYMLLQAYDFVWLNQHHGVTAQMGGSDQYGNIVVGLDLIRKMNGSDREAFGLTWPLVTKADGTKFGKTESGAVWLTAPRGPEDRSPARTSAYGYFQFWLNASDSDVGRFLRTFTFLSQEEILALEGDQARDPGARPAQRALARAATEIIHGPHEAQRAEAAARALFSGDVAHLDAATFREVLAEVPTTTHQRARLAGEGVALVDLLTETTLVANGSKREAREFLQSGSVAVNGRRAGPQDRVTTTDLLHGRFVALRRGKKTWHLSTWE